MACQRTTAGATIYSLITKESYDSKPTTASYDKAFDKFVMDFKCKQFKHLICPPMGCTRDKITVDHFMKKIIGLQRNTGAEVTIVILNEHSTRELRNGLTQNEFIKRIKDIIAVELKLKKPLSVTSSLDDSSTVMEATKEVMPPSNKSDQNCEGQGTSTSKEKICSVSIESQHPLPLLPPELYSTPSPSRVCSESGVHLVSQSVVSKKFVGESESFLEMSLKNTKAI